MRLLDLAIVGGFNLGLIALGFGFARRNRSAEHFMAAGRALPGWAVGMAIFGSFVSSISFLGGPGKSFAGNWNPFAFSLALPLAALIAATVFVPFYRRRGQVSAYEHLEHRFGPWARTYAVACYVLLQLTRTGVVMYLLAVALKSLLGGDVRVIILCAGFVMTIYPLLGGTEAAIWTGVVQSLVLVAGAALSLVWLIHAMPGGMSQIIQIGLDKGKFIGRDDFVFRLDEPTFWVVLMYGLVENLRNFGVTQTYVQSFITAESDRAARRSVWLAAGLYIPLSAVFFFIGTSLFAYYQLHAGELPAGIKADDVFPFYIGHALPAGVMGLIVAAICAAATDSNFNSVATLALCDVYKRHLRPEASEFESITVLRVSTVLSGVVSVFVALALTRTANILDVWWALAGILSGGMLGLFLLGILSRRAGNVAAMLGVAAGVLVIGWMTLSLPATQKLIGWSWPASLASLRSPFDQFMIPVFGTLAVLLCGAAAGFVFRDAPRAQPAELALEVSQ